MPRELDDPELTLEDMSRLADLIPGDVIEDRSRPTIDWARSLLVQISFLAGLLGVRLPPPRVADGVWLVWHLEKAWIRLRLYQRPPYSIEAKQVQWHLDRPDFRIAGAISSVESGSFGRSTDYMTFSVSGKFTVDFLLDIISNWFPLETMARSGSESGAMEERSWIDMPRLNVSGRYTTKVDPSETGDIHELVRKKFSSLARRDLGMGVVGMTLEQMSKLQQDWDGFGSPAPSKETLEWAGILFDNLRQAANALGAYVKEPETQLRSVAEIVDDPREVFIVIGWFLGTTLLEINVKTAADQCQASAVLDFDPDMINAPQKRYLVVQCRVAKDEASSPWIALRQALR